jgi:hypothetical protein
MNDKIERFDFKITTPHQYSVAANGKLMSETLLRQSKSLRSGEQCILLLHILLRLSITNFVKLTDTMGNPPFPFINYIYPSTNANTTI